MEKQNKIVGGLTMIALIALIAAYFAPIWWVSLTAPNYPEDAFPDGIRIHFHFDGVYNGCKAAGKGTHYVGMLPIATGAPVEKPLAKFFFGFFAVMMLAFMMAKKKPRLMVLTVGFAAVTAWMIGDQFVLGHLESHVQDYMKESGTFFKDMERINVWGENVRNVSKIVIFGLIGVMIFVIAAVAKIRIFQLVLALVPALLPVFFVITYAGWLWFFGLYGQAFHAHRLRRRQGRPVLDLLLSLLGLWLTCHHLCLHDAGATDPSQTVA